MNYAIPVLYANEFLVYFFVTNYTYIKMRATICAEDKYFKNHINIEML